MRRVASPGRLLALGLALIGVLAFALWLVPSNSYLLLPDRAKPLAERVRVPGEKPLDGSGGIYYVDVVVR
ncbi:MAG: hypothetical protein H0U07_08270, partial [Actinobacteria bacterium]|nr:hypothetical protein [Actinomycetota bacterium]